MHRELILRTSAKDYELRQESDIPNVIICRKIIYDPQQILRSTYTTAILINNAKQKTAQVIKS